MVTSENNRITSNNESPFNWLFRMIVENRSITYPMLCGIIDGFATSLKLDAKKWFDEQGNVLDKESSNGIRR